MLIYNSKYILIIVYRIEINYLLRDLTWRRRGSRGREGVDEATIGKIRKLEQENITRRRGTAEDLEELQRHRRVLPVTWTLNLTPVIINPW